MLETKAAAQNWLDALGTDKEAEQTKNLIAELEMDIMPVDNLIAFADSEAGAQVFGAEKAKNVAAHGREIKAAGAKYCDCPACSAVAAILEKKNELCKLAFSVYPNIQKGVLAIYCQSRSQNAFN